MRTMMITLLIAADQGEAVLALVQEDCISVTSAYIEDVREQVTQIVTQDRAGSIGKHKGTIRKHSERPLGEALLAEMRQRHDRSLSREEAAALAVQQFGMKPGSGPTYLSGLAKEGLVASNGHRSGRWTMTSEGEAI